jgi:putative methionine-R-sulfoxide reductase with GAF domain
MSDPSGGGMTAIQNGATGSIDKRTQVSAVSTDDLDGAPGASAEELRLAVDLPDGIDVGDTSTDLAMLFATIAQDLSGKPSVGSTLEETVRLAVDVVPGAEFAGVSWLMPDAEIQTPASTDPIVGRCDAAQYAFNEGPCVQSVWDGDLYQVDDLATDDRWPRFAKAAVDLGMRSMLACQLSSPKRTVGALNLYSREPAAFDEQSRSLIVIFAAHASVALVNRRMEGDLRAAIESRGTIGQAIGILIERHRITPDAAFGLLVTASQHRQIKVKDLAAELVETGTGPGLPNPASRPGIGAAAISDQQHD